LTSYGVSSSAALMVELKEKFHSGTVIGPTTYAGTMIDGLSRYTSRDLPDDVDAFHLQLFQVRQVVTAHIFP